MCRPFIGAEPEKREGKCGRLFGKIRKAKGIIEQIKASFLAYLKIIQKFDLICKLAEKLTRE